MLKFKRNYYLILNIICLIVIIFNWLFCNKSLAEYFVYDLIIYLISCFVFYFSFYNCKYPFKNYFIILNLSFLFIIISPIDLYEHITTNKIFYIFGLVAETSFFNYNRLIPIMYLIGIIVVFLFIKDLVSNSNTTSKNITR
jgi:hypothetical protein